MTLSDYMADKVPQIDSLMYEHLMPSVGSQCIYELATEYPARGGKRFRGALLLLSCETCGGDANRALPAAVAFEMFQSFALIHDDIEDDSLSRRGKPCLHRSWGIPLSLNAGDLLFAKAFEIMIKSAEKCSPDIVLSAMEEMVRGSILTFEGQALDLGWIRESVIPSEDSFLDMLRRKTGWYSGRGPCTLGALMAGERGEIRDSLGLFGEKMAMAFQIKDDLLNLTVPATDEAKAPGVAGGGYGKERGGDIMEGKRTFMVIHACPRLSTKDRERLLGILNTPREETTSEQVEEAIALLESTGSLSRARDLARSLLEEALDCLGRLPPSPSRDLLKDLAEFLVVDRKL